MKLDDSMMIPLVGGVVLIVWYFVSAKYRPRITTSDYRVISAPRDVLVSIPNTPEEGMEGSVIVIIGGMYGSGPSWIINSIPEEIKKTRNIILGEYWHPIDETITEGMKALAAHGVGEGLSISSISGFSSGGSQLMNAYEPHKFGKVFLIDPSASWIQARKDFEGEVVFLYGWDTHEEAYGNQYKEIIDEVLEAGGIVEEIDMDHYKFPEYTFTKYQNQL